MTNVIANLIASLGAGLLAPLTAVCVLPLYPGFLAYLANQTQGENKRKKIIIIGLIITLGVIVSMVVFGFIFTKLFSASLTNAIGIISPIAFAILGIVSILLIFNVDIGKIFPKIKTPTGKNPYKNSFLFGLFFGTIVLPCNPSSLVILFALSTSTVGFIFNFFNFVLFGIGMALPLLIFATISSGKSQNIINFLVRKKKIINVITGIIMLVISLYYLLFVFNIFGFNNNQENMNMLDEIKTEQNDKSMNTIKQKNDFVGLSSEQLEIKTTPAGTKYIIDPEKILSGGPPKDGIPSIDNPKFVSVKEADKFIEDNELVLALNYKEEKRVYPLQIMVWHEIVNDNVAGDPLLITYCPLCGSGIAYDRRIDGEEVEFGTSGKLYNSNLVMYDRKTDSYWTQIDGLSIVGENVGKKLKPISIDTVVWRDWKKNHPDSIVLNQDTGFNRPYGQDPYGNYYEDSFLLFPVDSEDNRIHPKTVVFGITVDGIHKAYKEDDLKKQPVIEDKVGETSIKVERDDVGVVKITNLDNGEEIVKERDFWFAWYTFHPDTLLFENK